MIILKHRTVRNQQSALAITPANDDGIIMDA